MQARGVVVDQFRRVMVDLVTMLKAPWRVARQGLSPSPPITTPAPQGGGGWAGPEAPPVRCDSASPHGQTIRCPQPPRRSSP
jgi:hypothetical protein